MTRRNKNKLPILDSDHDFLKVFEQRKNRMESPGERDEKTSVKAVPSKDRHGLPFLVDPDPDEKRPTAPEDEAESQDFASLLAQYGMPQKARPGKKGKSLPLQKRLKRYPPVEAQLDLHGYTAVGAEVKARSFIVSCKQQGFFTVRLVVGKGLHSDLGPVLPDVAEDLLKQLKKEGIVLWFEWDRRKKNKSGSLTVYLKQFDQYD